MEQALVYDFRAKLHLSFYDVGESVSYGEAYRLYRGLRVDSSTATFAHFQGWHYQSSLQEVFTGALLERVANLTLAEGQEPYRVTRPDDPTEYQGDGTHKGVPKGQQEERVTPEERARLRATLEANSAFG